LPRLSLEIQGDRGKYQPDKMDNENYLAIKAENKSAGKQQAVIA
jgi:hypothetical protein